MPQLPEQLLLLPLSSLGVVVPQAGVDLALILSLELLAEDADLQCLGKQVPPLQMVVFLLEYPRAEAFERVAVELLQELVGIGALDGPRPPYQESNAGVARTLLPSLLMLF